MLTAGPRAPLGLLSPGDRPIERGDRVHDAFGIWGALNCRAGFVVEDAAELPAGDRRLRRAAGRARTSRPSPSGTRRSTSGQTGGALQAIIDRRLGDPFFGIFLNPGPPAPPRRVGQLAGLRRARRSSSARAWPSRSTSSRPPARDYFTTNIEDGIALADAALRAAFAAALSGRLGAHPGAPRVHGATRSASTSTRTCCRSRTSRPTCRRSCSGPDRAMTLAG